MKKIDLKLIPIQIGDKTSNLSYKEQLRELMRQPPAAIDIEEVRRSLRVLEALDKSDDSLTLEDADYEHMKARVLSAKWQIVHPAIVQFVDDVTK